MQHTVLSSRDASALQNYLERIVTEVGDAVVHQGEDSDALYFIESGRVDVLLQGDGKDVLRLRSMTAGTVIGEVGFYSEGSAFSVHRRDRGGCIAAAQP